MKRGILRLLKSSIEIIQNKDLALTVLARVGQWMHESGLNPSRWWHPDNMNWSFFSDYAEPDEFYVALADGRPAAAMVCQWDQRNQDWGEVDKGTSPAALYIHWLCVERDFAGLGLSSTLVAFSEELARAKAINLVRVDTNASETKLRRAYEDLGFELVTTIQEESRRTAFYQKCC